MPAKKAKPLLPTLRERKRYLAFEVLSDKPVAGADVQQAIIAEAHALIGDLGMAEAGVWFIDEKWDAAKQRGMLRVTDTHCDKLKAVLTLIDSIRNQEVLVRSLAASGMIGKAERRIAG